MTLGVLWHSVSQSSLTRRKDLPTRIPFIILGLMPTALVCPRTVSVLDCNMYAVVCCLFSAVKNSFRIGTCDFPDIFDKIHYIGAPFFSTRCATFNEKRLCFFLILPYLPHCCWDLSRVVQTARLLDRRNVKPPLRKSRFLWQLQCSLQRAQQSA